MDINIKDDLLTNFSGNAKDKLREQIVQYSEELIKEAHLLEEAHRENGAKSEITSNIVVRASNVRRTMVPQKTPFWLKICKIASVISCSLAGFFFDADGFQNALPKLIAFVVFFAIACISTVFMFIKE